MLGSEKLRWYGHGKIAFGISLLTSSTGAADAMYLIGRSRLPAPTADCVLEKVSITSGKFITGGATFAMGNRDTPVHVSQNDYVSKLQWISKKFVVMWDEEEKRGWLVNGTSALLHLLRASLEYNRTDKFKSAFLFKSEEMEDAFTTHTADSAIEVLMNKTNMKLKIYPGKGEVYDEATRRKDAELDEMFKEKKTYLRLEDRVEHFYDILEKIMEHQVDVVGRSGTKLKLKARKYLEGWEFKDLATQRDPFYPRVATLDAVGKGWVDFTREIQAITLFGRGFGDILQPADPGKLCSAWAKLPRKKQYLAACVSDIQEIMEVNGDPDANPMRISDSIVWHIQGQVFEPCQCTGNNRGKNRHSDIAQVLFPLRLSYVLPKRKFIQLEDRGAVIFGHNAYFKWFWKDIGDPEQGDPPPPPEESETHFHDSAIGPSVGSSTEGSGGLAGSNSHQQSSERLTDKPLPDPPPSDSATGDEEDSEIANRHEGSGSSDVRQAHRRNRPKPLISYVLRTLRRHGGNVGE